MLWEASVRSHGEIVMHRWGRVKGPTHKTPGARERGDLRLKNTPVRLRRWTPWPFTSACRSGMTIGMTKAKIAITVPRPLLAKARRAVKAGYAESVSAYVTEALEEKTTLDDLKAMLDEMLAKSGGPLTPKERREAERMLGLRRSKRGRAA